MIHLIRVYRDDQIQPIHVEAFDKGEFPQVKSHRTDCRCMPTWTEYYNELADKYGLGNKRHGYQRYEFGHIDMEWIYPTPTKVKE